MKFNENDYNSNIGNKILLTDKLKNIKNNIVVEIEDFSFFNNDDICIFTTKNKIIPFKKFKKYITEKKIIEL